MTQPTPSTRQRSLPRRLLGPILLGSTLSLLGCGPADTVEITDVRKVAAAPGSVLVGATSAQRFGGEQFTAPSTPTSSLFRYTVPEGWEDAGAKSMRAVSLTAGEETQCFVIVLGGEAGGLLPNLNRWRGEVGLEPLDEVGVAALERIDLLGSSCPLFEASGDYQGQGGSSGADRTVLGTLVIRPQGSVFVKMVGPSEEVAANRQGFEEFVRSLEENR